VRLSPGGTHVAFLEHPVSNDDRGRAVVMGENTAGQVFLKSMFPFEDDSMVVLVTARGHYPDGRVFSFDGITPDNPVDPRRDDLPEYAARLIKHPPKGLK
jgi:C-terminal processing protease CtpA/Prc